MKILLPKPFGGRLLIEALEEDLQEFLEEKAFMAAGIKKEQSTLANLGFEVVAGETDLEGNFKLRKGRAPIKKAKILAMAEDAYQEAYKARYGDIKDIPKVGDTIYFILGKAFKIDLDERFYFVNDSDVVGFGNMEFDIKERPELIETEAEEYDRYYKSAT